jgi:hypothetical protein
VHRFAQAAVFCLIALFPDFAGAEVKIAPKDRVKNQPPGRCGWCAVETLARHHHIRALYGLTEDNPTRADPEDLEEALIDAGIPCHIQYPGNRGTQILRQAIEQDRGAAVGSRELFPGAGGHIVTLVDFNSKIARVIDSSDPKCHVRTMTREKFLFWWDGFALVLEPKKEKKLAGSK